MDPNAALETLRETVEWTRDGNADGSDMERAMWAFEALDEWLSKGGYLPADWQGRPS